MDICLCAVRKLERMGMSMSSRWSTWANMHGHQGYWVLGIRLAVVRMRTRVAGWPTLRMHMQ